MGITGHFIEVDTWRFRSLLLGSERLHGSHSADALARVTCSVLQHFQLSSHIRAITSDNVSVNTKMLTILEDSLTGFTVQDSQVRCMAHIINHTAQQILSHLKVVPSEDEDHETNISVSMKSIPIAFTRARNII